MQFCISGGVAIGAVAAEVNTHTALLSIFVYVVQTYVEYNDREDFWENIQASDCKWHECILLAQHVLLHSMYYSTAKHTAWKLTQYSGTAL